MARGASRRQSAASASVAAQRRRRNRWWLGGLGGAAVVGIVAAIALTVALGGSDSALSGTAPEANSQSGDRVPEFSFTLFQGEDVLGSEEVNIADLHGKPIVLNFWAGLCPPCRAEMPDLQRFYDDFKGRVTLVGIDVGQFTGLGSHRDARNLLKELGITYPAGFTNDRGVIRDYEVFSMPTTVFINANGEVFQKWSGALTQEILERMANAMLRQAERPQS